MSSTVFYVMAGAIFLELLIILALLVNIKILLKAEKEKVATTEFEIAVVERKSKPLMSWWNRFNKFKPVAQEADIDLGHDYDGIRELDNRLPPWWLYGFYITIVFAGVYLWRAHVSHAAPSSKEEYEMAVRRADIKVKEYLKQKGDAVDENTVTMLGTADIEEGKKLFIATCAVCHKENGAGLVGPNLTDDYWIHGGDVKNIFRIIKYGVDGKGMASWQGNFSPKQIAQLTSYVKSLKGTNPPDAKTPQGDLYKDESIPAVDSAVVKENKVAVK
jgi:cytochrome c oxidase cbb3-type subunit III